MSTVAEKAKTAEILKEADFRRQIKTAPALGYLFFGEEDYLKQNALSLARETIVTDASFACFNELTVDALDYTPEALRSALLPMPMMAERKLVVLRGLDFTALRPSDIEGLLAVLEELPEYDYNTLIIPVADGLIDEGYLPKRPSALLNRLGEHLALVRFERCTPAKLYGWCNRHFEHNGAVASESVCAALVETCGRSMFTLASEIDKISFYALSHGRKEITKEDIASAACVATEYDTFAFTNALTERNKSRALDILADMKFRRTEPLFILSEVIRVACDMLSVRTLAREGRTATEIASLLKLHEFKVSLYLKATAGIDEASLRRSVDACMDADRALKNSPQGYAALERLICAV